MTLHEPFQSPYRIGHSTETAVLRVQNDILRAVDDGKCVFLVLLNLSAAFDTVSQYYSETINLKVWNRGKRNQVDPVIFGG